jgi:hypothetical protein
MLAAYWERADGRKEVAEPKLHPLREHLVLGDVQHPHSSDEERRSLRPLWHSVLTWVVI